MTSWSPFAHLVYQEQYQNSCEVNDGQWFPSLLRCLNIICYDKLLYICEELSAI